jgi:non-homologous end joining protein Ku
MAPRPQWKGYLKLSIVSCPINLYPAVSAAEKVSFRQINAETGNRLRQQLVDSVTGEVVGSHNKGRGYEVGENQFLPVGDEELKEAKQAARTRPFTPSEPRGAEPEPEEQPVSRRAALRVVGQIEPEKVPPPPAPAPAPRPIVENTRTIELDRFIPRLQIDPRYYNTPYYIAPSDEVGLEAFSVIRDAMKRKGLVGMGRIVLANRERPLFIEPMGAGLLGMTLRYAHEIRDESEYLAAIPPVDLPDDVVEVTELILNSKLEDFDTTYLEDRYRTELVERLREKQATMPRRPATPMPSQRNIINLMDALKASLAAQKPPAQSKPRATKRAAAATAKPSAKGAKSRRV